MPVGAFPLARSMTLCENYEEVPACTVGAELGDSAVGDGPDHSPSVDLDTDCVGASANDTMALVGIRCSAVPDESVATRIGRPSIVQFDSEIKRLKEPHAALYEGRVGWVDGKPAQNGVGAISVKSLVSPRCAY